jgi:hypothetical protein
MSAALGTGYGVEFCFEGAPGGFEIVVPYFCILEVKDGRPIPFPLLCYQWNFLRIDKRCFGLELHGRLFCIILLPMLASWMRDRFL